MKKVAIEGELEYFPLQEVFYLLSRFRKTGRLIIKEKGNIYISDGHVLHAENDESDGIEAFFNIAMTEEGKFKFQPDEKPSVNTISEPLSELIEEVEAREAELQEYRKDLPPLDTKPEKSSKTPEGEKVNLKKKDWKVLILANGNRNLQEIISSSPLNELNTLKALSWLFKEGLLYDPEEKKRVLEEGIDEINRLLDIFDKGPWVDKMKEVIEEYELDESISLGGTDLIMLKNDFPLDLKKTKEFFTKMKETLEKEASETLGKLLVKKRMKEVNES